MLPQFIEFKLSEFKVKFRQANNRSKRVLEAAKFAYATKTKETITSQKLGSRDFWLIANSVLNKGNLDDSGISLPVFSSRSNLKLHISIIIKIVKKVIKNLDSSKASVPDYSGGSNEL